MSAADACLGLVRKRQSERRLPSVSATVFKGRETLWYGAAGHARLDPATEPTADTQYAVGSITKTFTAVLVMQLRDAGELHLDDRLEQHVPGTPHGSATIRRMLSHTSGLQRETPGEVWESLVTPGREQLLADLADAEAVSAPSRRFHYSNLAYALLGEIVARRTGSTWEEVLRERILTPLGLTRTSLLPEEPYAPGYFVDPYADRAADEPLLVLNGVASAAALWSTAGDMARWGGFLLDPDPAVLAPATVEEMTTVHGMADESSWAVAYGLGLILWRRDRIAYGHLGGMPGHLSGIFVSRKDGVGAAAFANNSAAFDPGPFTMELLDTWVSNDPAAPDPWVPGEAVPEDVEPMLGRWWTEGSEYVFSWRGGRLEALPAGAAAGAPPAVFEREGDGFRGVSGREAGERLRVVRTADGRVSKMYWATYPLTREPLAFGASK